MKVKVGKSIAGNNMDAWLWFILFINTKKKYFIYKLRYCLYYFGPTQIWSFNVESRNKFRLTNYYYEDSRSFFLLSQDLECLFL